MTPEKLNKLRSWARNNEGGKLTQAQAAEKLGLQQTAISRAEAGELTLATETAQRYIEALTPCVLFITGDRRDAELIASYHIMSQHRKTITETVDGFYDLLKAGLDIVVLTDDRAPYLDLIKLALRESGLNNIPVRGIWINGNGTVEEWND